MRLITDRAGHIVGWTTHKILLWKPLLFVYHFMLSYQALPCSSSLCSSSPSLSSPCFSILQVTRNWWPWQKSTVALWQPCDSSLCRIATPIYDRMLGLQILIPAVCIVKNEWWTPVIYTFRPLYSTSGSCSYRSPLVSLTRHSWHLTQYVHQVKVAELMVCSPTGYWYRYDLLLTIIPIPFWHVIG